MRQDTIARLTVTRSGPEGSARQILFIHGMWEGAWIWQNYLDFFAKRGYSCIALNLRGHHDSRPVDDIGQVALTDYVADAAGVRAALGDPILVGHSMGGLIVQKLIEQLEAPAAVAITPAAPRGIMSIRTWVLLKASTRHLAQILGRKPLSLSRDEAIGLMLNRIPTAEIDDVYRQMVPESGRQTFDLAVKGLPVNAKTVASPFLVISGSEDRITPSRMVGKIAKKYHADLFEYAGHGHLIMLEPDWELPATEVADWLEAKAGPVEPPPQS